MKQSHKREQVDNGRERRRFVRIAADAMPHVTARVVGGPQVRLIDVSRRGAQVETTLPLKPGRSVTIRFVAADATLTLTGAVVRSSVAVLADEGVKYHTALSFAEDIVICPEVAPPRATDAPAASLSRTATQTIDEDATASLTDVMVVRTPDETGEALRDRLLANSW
jgi:hypothetical protein